MKAYSSDLRERVLRAVDEGKPRTQIIELFHVSRATIKRYLKLRRETGQVQPHVIPGRTPKKGGRCERRLKKPSRSSKRFCVEWMLAHAKHLRKPSARPCSPSWLPMRVGGFGTRAMFPLEKAAMANSILWHTSV